MRWQGRPQDRWWNPASWLNRRACAASPAPPPFGSWDRSIVPWHTTCEHPPVGVAWLGDSRKERSNAGLEANTIAGQSARDEYDESLIPAATARCHKTTIRISAWNQGSQKLVGLPQAIPGPVIPLVDGYCSAISINGLSSTQMHPPIWIWEFRYRYQKPANGSRSGKTLFLRHFQTSSSWSVLHLHELVPHQNPCLIVKKAFLK